MVQIKVFTEKQYYLSKYGEKQYLDGGEGDNTLVTAALLTGKGLNSDEHLVYTTYGETEAEAQKSVDCYIQVNPEQIAKYRTEVTEN